MKEHQHSYAGGYCTICFKKQPVFKDGKEQGLSSINSGVKTSYKPPQARKKKITSEFQAFIDDLMGFLGEDVYKKGNFSKYCGVVKRYGKFQVRIWVKQMKERGISNPKYFFGIIRNQK